MRLSKPDPNNKTLYYYEGLTYSQVAEAAGADIKKLQRAAEKAAKSEAKPVADPKVVKLQQSRNESYAKAADQYKKGPGY